MVERGLDATDGLLAINSAGDGEPSAKAEFAYLQLAFAQGSSLHRFSAKSHLTRKRSGQPSG
jgi:hypothetical protein